MDNSKSRSSLIREFRSFTGSSEEEANFFLDAAKSNLQNAVAQYFEGQETSPIAARPSVTSDEAPRVPVPNPPRNLNGARKVAAGNAENPFSDNSKRKVAPHSSFRTSGADPSASATRKLPRRSNKITTLNDFGPDNVKGFYTGDEKSGQLIQGPDADKKDKDYVTGLFDAAKKSGAREVEEDNGEKKRDSGMFSSSARTVGERNAATKTREEKEARLVTIAFWANGFTVDGQPPLRDYDQDSAFLESIKAGRVPVELAGQGVDVRVSLEDRRPAEWEPPKEEFKAFSGVPLRMGAEAPAPSQFPLVSEPKVPKTGGPAIVLRPGEKEVKIRIRLPDGSSMTGTFNPSHSVRDVLCYASGSGNVAGMELMLPFPRKMFSEVDQTIEDAGLAGSSVILKTST